MPQIELTELDLKNLLGIINNTTIKGQDVELLALLKQKLSRALQPPTQSLKEE